MFTTENTSGYTAEQCEQLNAEFERRFAAGDWPVDRDQAEKSFSDEVGHR